MPVFTDPVSDYRQLRLGQSVRELRKNKGWTLKELASRIPMSVASLSALENDKAALDLEQLVAVSEALGVRPDALLPKSRRSHFHLTRRATLESLPALPLRATDRSGTSTVTLGYNLLRPLAAPFVGRHIEPLHTELLPATDEEIRFVSHHDEEFLFVLRGAVECLLRTPDGEVKEELLPGDCMYFWSCLPHCLRAASGQSASVIRVLHSGYGAIGSERADAAIWVADGPRKSLTEQVALKICGLRKGAGLASAELARDLEIGVRRLADIERGRKPVTIDLLLRVCRRFRKPLEYFLVSTAMARPFHVVHRGRDIVRLPRRTRRRLVDSGWGQTEFRSLASGLELRGMHPYYVKVQHTRESELSLHEHHGQEFVYVLDGEVTFETLQDGEPIRVTLSVGDSCLIDSTVPHRFVGRGSSPYGEAWARVIDVFWCPLGESYLFEDDDEPPALSRKQTGKQALIGA